MKPKRKEFREPETRVGWTFDNSLGEIGTQYLSTMRLAVPGRYQVRIIRERDYKRLLRAAKGKGK